MKNIFITALGATIAWLSWGQMATAGTIVRVEETWSLEVAEPDLKQNGPQVTMTMSPAGGLDGVFFLFSLNYKNFPQYQAGGLQVSQFYGEKQEQYKTGPACGALQTNEETLVWTQSISLENGNLTFEIKDGNSVTWGAFGGQGYLKISIPSSATSLNHYSPLTSIEESEIGYAGNRVASLKLMKIRWHFSNGRVYEKNAPIDIHTDLEPWNEEIGD